MLKLMILPRRRLGITRDEMHAHALGAHASLVLGHIRANPDQAPRRYVQNHVIDGTRAATPSLLATVPDMVTQVWFDGPEQARAALTHPFHRETLAPDEDRFVDQSQVQRIPSREQWRRGVPADAGRDAPCKAFVLLPKPPALEADRFAAAASAFSEALGGLPSGRSLQAQVHNIATPRPGDAVVADAVDECWFASEAEARAFGRQALSLAEELGRAHDWLQPSSAVLLVAREHVLFVG